MTGAIALHGGGEFMPGDEPFLRALLEGALAAGHGGRTVRVVIVPTAAARHRPEATGRHGREAIERVGAAGGIAVDVDVALIVDTAAANDPAVADRLAKADLIYLPGGDPDLLPQILRDSLAWRSILAAHERGAVIAGASAGAMALATRTWTPHGWLDGLGLVEGLVIVPHYNEFDPRGWETTVDELTRAGLGYLGIDEQTGVVSSGSPNGATNGAAPVTTWRVVGSGRVQWFPMGGERVSGTNGATLPLPVQAEPSRILGG